jgi:hypothetical protein
MLVRHRLMSESSMKSIAPSGRPSANYTPLILAGAAGFVFTLVGIGGLIGRFASPKVLIGSSVVGFAALAIIASQTKLEGDV